MTKMAERLSRKIEERAAREQFAKPHQEPVVADHESVAGSNSQSELDRRLDDALKETFPASDPISIVISSGK